ncbi:MAG: ATP-binding protein [bacterium]|nr:ATP-binding protein [bacterium]
MITRSLQNHLQTQLAHYPAVALLGARQVGKTTLAKTFGGHYYDLENPQDRLRLDIEWEERVNAVSLMILDEAQTMPEIFPRLRSAIDTDRARNSRFLLLGSVSPTLMTQVSQALTGRLALCPLTPFLARELPAEQWDPLWHTGGYPDGGIVDPARFPNWQHNYLDLMAQRDLPNWGLPARPAMTSRLFRMLAALHGQIWNASQIGKSLGLNYHTVNTYVDYLEQAYLIRRLPAYATNIKKRLVKSPKIYWRDTGLLHALLGLHNAADLYSQPWVGFSWEGWIMEQILGHLQSRGESFQAFHLRTSDQYEIDLLLEYRNQLWAFEIKLSSAPNTNSLNRLRHTAEQIGADHTVLISRTTQPIQGDKVASLNLATTLDLLENP